MNDLDIIRHIDRLVDEEHRLRRVHSGRVDVAERLTEVEVTLDQCWDLLRQRRSLRIAGRDPADAAVRSASVVERYLQ